jgi:PadR family transcriptional regulator, regulatory protein PadR
MEPLTRVTAATVAVLDALLEHPDGTWGLLIIKRSGRPAGTVYPILDRLERSGWVESRWEEHSDRSGPRRRYYRLTDDGAAAARDVVGTFRTRERAVRTPLAASRPGLAT